MKRYVVLVLFSFIFSFQVYCQTNTYFPLGTYTYNKQPHDDEVKLLFNTIITRASSTSSSYLQTFNGSIADNSSEPDDYIHNYTLGYYHKWEAEEDLRYSDNAGIKHQIGDKGKIDNTDCWLIPENPVYNEEDNLFIYGPHAAQEGEFRQTRLTELWELVYNINIRMKVLQNVNPNTPVCSVSVVYNYSVGEQDFTKPLKDTVLNADAFTNSFQDRTFMYSFPPKFKENPFFPHEYFGTGYDDTQPGQGVQYIIKWLGDVRFAVDYIEIYDYQKMSDYISNRVVFGNRIKDKALEQQGLSNLQFWHSSDAPLVEDLYAPYRIVDSVLTDNNYPSLFTAFYPRWNNSLNGYNTMERIIEYCKPKKFINSF